MSDYPPLRGFHAGVRSVYEQAKHDGRNEIAEWIAARYPAAVEQLDDERKSLVEVVEELREVTRENNVSLSLDDEALRRD